MDISTHSSASSISQPQQAVAARLGGLAAAPSNNSNSNATNANPGRKPPATAAASREQKQLEKLREANAKYKNLLKLAKGRIQEQEGVLDERRGE